MRRIKENNHNKNWLQFIWDTRFWCLFTCAAPRKDNTQNMSNLLHWVAIKKRDLRMAIESPSNQVEIETSIVLSLMNVTSLCFLYEYGLNIKPTWWHIQPFANILNILNCTQFDAWIKEDKRESETHKTTEMRKCEWIFNKSNLDQLLTHSNY